MSTPCPRERLLLWPGSQNEKTQGAGADSMPICQRHVTWARNNPLSSQATEILGLFVITEELTKTAIVIIIIGLDFYFNQKN